MAENPRIEIHVSKEEAQLISVLRQIHSFDRFDLIDPSQVGEVLDALTEMVDLDALGKDLSSGALKQLIYGFIAGLAFPAQQQLAEMQAAYDVPAYDLEEDEEPQYTPPEDDGSDVSDMTVAGGPSGGVVHGQTTGDPRYVTQTGVRSNEK